MKEKAADLLRLKANKKLVQQKISEEAGKVILLKDLSNLASSLKATKTRNDLDTSVQTLMERYGANVDIYSDADKNFKGLFFQDQEMRDTFSAYPELLCVDATYKLLELGIPLYIFVCEDSNGQSEIVAACLLVNEDADSVLWMMDSFKERNKQWEKIRIVMADKDVGERDIIKRCLPNAAVLICLFHALRSFRREMTCEKMGITSGQRTFCLELIQKMAYAKSVQEYTELHDSFVSSAPREVSQYFNENWNIIRDEWVIGIICCSGNFLNFTNNRLESINGKLKQVVNRHSTLEDFVEKFFIILTALRTERDHKAALACQKVKVSIFHDNSPECRYQRFLTPFAADFVCKQLKLVEKVSTFTRSEDDGDYFTVNTSEGPKTVSKSSCECIFFKSMLLPCRHVLALRKKLDEPLYDETLCEQRWTSSYYKSNQRMFVRQSNFEPSLTQIASDKHVRKLTQHQKFREASIVTSELASVASYASSVHFERRIKLLKDLVDHWKNCEEVALVEVDNSSSEEEVPNEELDDLRVEGESSEGSRAESSKMTYQSIKQSNAVNHSRRLFNEIQQSSSTSNRGGKNVCTGASQHSSESTECQTRSSKSLQASRTSSTQSNKPQGEELSRSQTPQLHPNESQQPRLNSTIRSHMSSKSDNSLPLPQPLISPPNQPSHCSQPPLMSSDSREQAISGRLQSMSSGSQNEQNSSQQSQLLSLKAVQRPDDSSPSKGMWHAEQEAQFKNVSMVKSLAPGKRQPLSDITDKQGSSSKVSLGLKVGPKLKTRGRPRGHELTTVGLPLKRAKKSSKNPITFAKKHTSMKEEAILSWLVDDKKICCDATKHGVLIEEEHVECQPEKLPCSILDENVDVYLVRRYFTNDAWLLVEDVLHQKEKAMIWTCDVCFRDLHSDDSGPSVICECCLKWSHFSCVGLLNTPKTKSWFCRSCYVAS